MLSSLLQGCKNCHRKK